MDKRTAICEFLRKHHTGKDKAIYSDETGYYYAETQKEINDTVCRLNSLVLRISNARTGMLYASVMSDDPVMVNININLE